MSRRREDKRGRGWALVVILLLLLAALFYADRPRRSPPVAETSKTVPPSVMPPPFPVLPAEPLPEGPIVAPEPPAVAPEQAPVASEPPPITLSPPPVPEIASAPAARQAEARVPAGVRYIRPRKRQGHPEPSYGLADPCATWSREADWCTEDGPWPGETAH